MALIALFAWWLWPAEEEQAVARKTGELVSEVADSDRSYMAKVEPISLSSAAAEPVVPSSSARLKFEQARRAANSGNTRSAIRIYQELIGSNKKLVEPYINLAALYAQTNQLDLAQQTLTQGLNADDNYATLFASLQQVLGALAANAYQDALEQEGDKIAALKLPRVSTLAENDVQQEQMNLLQERITYLQSEANRANQSAQSAAQISEKLQLAENKLGSANETIDRIRTEYQQQLAGLQSQLSEQNARTQNLLASNERIQAEEKTQLIAAREQVLKAQQQQAALDGELEQERVAREKLEAELLAQQQLAKEQQLVLENELAKQKELARQQEIAKQAEIDEAREQARQEALAKQQQLVRQQEADRQLAIEQQADQQRRAAQQALAGNESQQAQAVELINSWAAAWSRQAVSDYVDHYASDYVPTNGKLTHQQWLDQRRVRLTNKTFIQVSVSNFDVRTTDAGFDVTFSQHYKSNTMDDVIRKRLSFAANGDDWSSAKIIGERVIR
ncbi:MAG: hypothetical protein KJP04_02940 [Arenicella sp.]|nr:hypothetical protein [Arenicella sp.]